VNNLSWLIYIAEVVPNLGSFCVFLAVVSGCLVVLIMVVTVLTIVDEDETARKFLKIKPIKFVPIFFLFVSTGSILTPSKEALYLIAASEAGEVAVTSPEGQEILNDLQQVLKAQLEALKTPK